MMEGLSVATPYTWERTEGKSIIDLFLLDQRIRRQVTE